jgi:hypothetical protein
MANTTTGRRGSGGQLTLVWMALALVLVAGFLYWLAANSEPSRMVAVEEDAGEVAPDPMAAGTQVGRDDFAANPDQYRGRTVELSDVEIAATIGAQAFWIDLPRQPFLVRLAPGAETQGVTIQPGQRVTIVGPVLARTDSVLAAWEREGVITSEGQRMEMEFATTFIEARRVVVGQPAAR